MNVKHSILKIVEQIPLGKVMYYGQIADLLGISARTAGFIMNSFMEEEMQNIPWYRVVAKDGYISSLKLGRKGKIQKTILEREGYSMIDNDKVDMNIHLWLFAGINHSEDLTLQYVSFVENLKR